MKDFLDNISPYTYDYTDPTTFGEGRRAGPMAQDLEQAGPVGQSMVMQGPGGVKMVDGGQAALASLGAVAQLNDRIKMLEERQPEVRAYRRRSEQLRPQQTQQAIQNKRTIEDAEFEGPDPGIWEQYLGNR